MRTLEQLTNRLRRTLARQPLSSFNLERELIVVDPKSLVSRRATLFCRPGSVLKGRMCGEQIRLILSFNIPPHSPPVCSSHPHNPSLAL